MEQGGPEARVNSLLNRKTAVVVSVLIFVALYAWGLIAALAELSGRKGQV